MYYQPVIGLEVHLQLNTQTKMFCNCQNDSEEKEPNLNICPICLGYPGVLPVINQRAIEKALLMGLALKSKIASFSEFDRKNYFYPDLPKGYQISQYQIPLCKQGCLKILKTKSDLQTDDKKLKEEFKKIRIQRINLEEDAAKLIHSETGDYSLIDFNRSGTPLLEIVSEPDLRTAEEAKIFLQELQRIARYLEISQADMEKGQMRCDANISLLAMSKDVVCLEDIDFSQIEKLTRVEIKNMNSFRAVEQALNYEINRQKDLLEQGEKIDQETRKWDEQKSKTLSMRGKEEAEDYRYFPEPDLPPFFLEQSYLEELKKSLAELPERKRERLREEYQLLEKDIKILIDDKNLADYFEKTISEIRAWLVSLRTEEIRKDLFKILSPDFLKQKKETWEEDKKDLIKLTCDWLINRLIKFLSAKNISIKENKISPENFAEFILLIHQKAISSSIGQTVLEEMIDRGIDPSLIILEKNLVQISSEEDLQKEVERIIEKNPKPVEDFKKGKEKALKFLVGQVMRQTKGRANPEIVEKILGKMLNS